MPNCTADEMNFGRMGRRVIEANFQGGAISSDGGLMLLRQLDRRLSLSKAIAAGLHDPQIIQVAVLCSSLICREDLEGLIL